MKRTTLVEQVLLWTAIGLVLFALAASACGCDLYRPACRPEALGEIEAAYLAEATASCAGYTFETCPTLPAIEAKYATRREEWARCQ